MTIIDIFLLILIITATTLCGYAIISLKRITGSLKLFQSDFQKLVEQAVPVLENLKDAAEKAKNVSSTTERHVLEISDKIDLYKSRANDYLSRIKNDRTDNQVISAINNIRAFVKGLSAFLRDLKE